MHGDRHDFGGMTVNERLVAAGVLDQFDTAITSRDRQEAVEILVRVEMSDSGAAETVDAILANPARYGYPRSS